MKLVSQYMQTFTQAGYFEQNIYTAISKYQMHVFIIAVYSFIYYEMFM